MGEGYPSITRATQILMIPHYSVRRKNRNCNKIVIIFFWHFRSEAVSWRVMGTVNSPLGQVGEGLQDEGWPIWRQQDPRHIRLHQVRPTAQPEDHSVWGGQGAVWMLQSFGRHCYTSGIVQVILLSINLFLLVRKFCEVHKSVLIGKIYCCKPAFFVWL